MRLQPFDLRRRLYIIFKGEEGLDYGGIARYVSLVLCFVLTATVCCNRFIYDGIVMISVMRLVRCA